MTFGSNVQPRRTVIQEVREPWTCRCGVTHKYYISRCSRCRDPRDGGK